MTPREELRDLVGKLGHRSIAPVVYDTAWVARVGEADSPGRPAFPEALDWLLGQQWGDGTWGARLVVHHDRVLSTLAGLVTLAQWREVAGDLDGWSERIQAAAWGVAAHVAALSRDPVVPAGFGPLCAGLIQEARWRGVALPLPRLAWLAQAATAPPDPPRPSENGSIGDSPASTAAFLLRRPGCREARAYLHEVVRAQGGSAAPALYPADRFESAWVLRNVALSGARPGDLGDDAPDPERLLALERDEATRATVPSPSPATIDREVDLLRALRAAPDFDGREAAIHRLVGSLARKASPEPFWIDGRHASPYFATAEVVLALGPEYILAEEAVAWIERSQRADGSWGQFETATAEETACCLQALAWHRRSGGRVSVGVIERGASWLADARDRAALDYEPLWLGHTLYAPTWVVHSTVLSALALCSD